MRLVAALALVLLACSDDGPTEGDCVAKENEIRRRAKQLNVPEDYVCDNTRPDVVASVKTPCDEAKACRAELAKN